MVILRKRKEPPRPYGWCIPTAVAMTWSAFHIGGNANLRMGVSFRLSDASWCCHFLCFLFQGSTETVVQRSSQRRSSSQRKNDWTEVTSKLPLEWIIHKHHYDCATAATFVIAPAPGMLVVVAKLTLPAVSAPVVLQRHLVTPHAFSLISPSPAAVAPVSQLSPLLLKWLRILQ